MFTYLFVSVAQAAGPLQLPGVVTGLKDGAAIVGQICAILNWVFFAAIVFSVFLILRAAFLYMTSGGEPEKLKAARDSLIYIALGIAVAVLAQTIPVIVGSLFSVNGLSPCNNTTQPTTPTTYRVAPLA